MASVGRDPPVDPQEQQLRQVEADLANASKKIDEYAEQTTGFFKQKKYLVVATDAQGRPKLECRTLNLFEIWDAKRNNRGASAKLTFVAEYLANLQNEHTRLQQKGHRSTLTDKTTQQMTRQFAGTVANFLDKQIKVENMRGDAVSTATKLVNCFQPGQLAHSHGRIQELIIAADKGGKDKEAFALFQKLPVGELQRVLCMSTGGSALLKNCLNDTNKKAEIQKMDRTAVIALIDTAASKGCYPEALQLFKLLPEKEGTSRWDTLSSLPSMKNPLLKKALLKEWLSDPDPVSRKELVTYITDKKITLETSQEMLDALKALPKSTQIEWVDLLMKETNNLNDIPLSFLFIADSIQNFTTEEKLQIIQKAIDNTLNKSVNFLLVACYGEKISGTSLRELVDILVRFPSVLVELKPNLLPDTKVALRTELNKRADAEQAKWKRLEELLRRHEVGQSQQAAQFDNAQALYKDTEKRLRDLAQELSA